MVPLYRDECDTQRQSVGKLSESINQSLNAKNNYNIAKGSRLCDCC